MLGQTGDLAPRMEALIELMNRIGSEREPQRLLQIACDAARVIVGARYAAIGMLGPDGQSLQYFVTSGMDPETIDRIGPLPVGRGVLGKLLSEGLPLRLRDLTSDPASVGFPAGHPRMNSFLGVPLATPSGLYGRLYLTEKIGANEFSGQDEYVAVALAAQVAVAFENAHRFEEIQQHTARLQAERIERKRVEDALWSESWWNKHLIESNLVGIVIGEASGKIISANDYYLKLLGVSRAEFLAGEVDWRKFTPPEWLTADEASILELKERGVSQPYEKEYQRSDGTRVSVFIANTFLPGPEQQIAAIVLDITGRKQVEKTLRESEARFIKAFRSSPVAIIISRVADGKFIDVNEAACQIYGYERHELLGRTSLELGIIDTGERRKIIEALASKQVLREQEVTVYSRKMGLRQVLYSMELLDFDGEQCLLTAMVDITDRKRMEEALRESEARFRHAVQDAPYPVQIHAEDGEVILVNQAWTDLTGYSAAEIPTIEAWIKKAYPDRVESILQEVRQLYEADGRVEEGEDIIQTAGGESRIWSFSSAPLGHLPDGRRLVISMAVDITERKQVEEAVKDSEKRFRALVENAPDGIALLGMNGKLRQITPTVRQILGYSMEEAVGQDPAIFTHPDDLPGLLELLGDVIQNPEKVLRAEYRFRHRDGSWRWLESTISNLIGEPSVNAIVFNYRDITWRKQAEVNLKASEERFRLLFENNHNVMLLIEPETGEIRSANIAAADFYGYSVSDLCSMNITQMNQLSPEEQRAERMRAVNEERNYFSFQHRLAGGDVRFVEVRSTPIELDGSTLLFSIIHDITERKKAEARIQQQVQQLNALRTIDIAISSSFDLRVVLEVVLQQVVSLLGVDAGAVLLYDRETKTIEYAASRGFQSGVLHDIRLRMGEGYASQAALKLRTIHLSNLLEKSGKLAEVLRSAHETFMDYYGTPLIVKGEIKGVLEVYHRSPLDPDEGWLEFLETLAGQAAIAIDNAQLFESLQRTNAELELRVAERTAQLHQTNAELEQANRAKDEFLANMSHELRTPLNSILGLSESLLEERRGMLNEYQKNSLQIIGSSGEHLLELINDILDLSKIEAGMFDFFPQTISVDEFCRSCLAFIKVQALKKSIIVNYINEASVTSIDADPRRLKQILVNLLTNAIKFTAENGHVTLQVTADREKEQVRFSVIDDGIGIAAADMRKLFKPFVQLDGSLNRQYEGTGLGLALVQKLTELHGGSVQVESEPGKGSCFTVNLSYVPAPSRVPGSSTPLGPLALSGDAQPSTLLAAGLILLAEDNRSNILTIGDYLESRGYKVVMAYDGLEAVEQTNAFGPDLILMDIQMPVLNGLEAIARLRSNERFASTPIIALTALAMPGDRERCLMVGATEYMSKPVSLKQLLATIRKLMGTGP